MEINDSFGYWIRRRRKALDLTQDELAQCVGCAGVTLRKIESDERRPSRQMAERLAQCLALPASDLPMIFSVLSGERGPARLELPTEPIRDRTCGNLPAPVTTLVGRSAEITDIMDCLRRKDVRLHTLTGPIGVGKTRLAIEVGHRICKEFRDGVYLVALASVLDPTLVPSATAKVLGIPDARGQSLTQSLAGYLAHKEMLLIFDNFEHLQPASIFLYELLAEAPGLRLLVTSRSSLRIYSEHEFRIAPLALPDPNDQVGAVNIASVQLFCERAQAARADFHLTPTSVPVVIDICRRLDGLPLAIELAATRIKLFSPLELQHRLEHRLLWLTQNISDQFPRVQGLESAIARSYDLLSPSERTLLTRLSVFVDGFTLPAAEAVCGFPFTKRPFSTGRAGTLDITDITLGVSELLDQSLLLRQDIGSESRFMMLETIREYAIDQLKAKEEFETIQQRHAEYFVTCVEQSVKQLDGPDQTFWLAHLERDIGNLRAALTWLLATDQVQMAVQMVCALRVFCKLRGHYNEGGSWLEQVLMQADLQ